MPLVVSAEQASALVVAGAELMVMPARYLYQMLRPPQWRPRSIWRAAINAILGSLVELSASTRLRNAKKEEPGMPPHIIAGTLVLVTGNFILALNWLGG